MRALITGVLIVTVAGVMLTDKGRTLAKGFLNLFFEDVAKTPQGANAIYQQAIEECQKDYNKADNNLKRVSGMLISHKNKVSELEKNISADKTRCENLVQANRFEDAELIAQRISEMEEEKVIYINKIKELEPMLESAKSVHTHLEAKLNKLKKDKNIVVKQLEINKQQEDLYNDLNELKNVKGVDKLLSSVKEEVVSSNERVAGARTVHENRTSTKIQRIDQSLRSSQASSYVEELKRKYNK